MHYALLLAVHCVLCNVCGALSRTVRCRLCIACRTLLCTVCCTLLCIVLLAHPGAVPCPLFPVPLHSPLLDLLALPALRADVRKRCCYASCRCRAKPCSCSAMSALAAKNGRARSPAHKRPPSGMSALQRSLGAPCSMRPAAMWRCNSRAACRRTCARSPSGGCIPCN